MDANGMAEPNSEIWYGMGLIAEQYGETAAALENYSRVEEPAGGDYSPTWTYALAQKRIKVLTGSRQFTATGIVH